MSITAYSYPRHARAIHFGLAAFGITAYLTAEFAEAASDSWGYLIHAYLGFGLGLCIALRLALGFTSSETLSFKDWSPLLLKQWEMALADLKSLLTLNLPERDRHQGLAGLIQAFGLFIFVWMAITGTLLFIIQESTGSVTFEIIEEAHEIGEGLIPLFLAIHIGAVILHTLTGNPIWKKMFSSKEND